DLATIRIENSDSYKLSVVDIQGRVIYTSILTSGDNSIECSEWKSGFYQFVLTNKTSLETKVVSFMKQ
ncbi:MAG: T9SS type A sorting domain-containing protein, partial [Fluviicola sp.]